MQTTIRNSTAPNERPGRWKLRLKTLTSSPGFGYTCSVFLVGFLLFLEKLDAYLPHAPLFTSAPFALVAVFTALVWGIGPALVSFVLGISALIFYVSPDPLAGYLLSDMLILGPFLLLQLIAIVVIISLERSRRKLLMAHRQLQSANQQLAQAVRLKDYIIIRAAHELKTPLTTILGRTQLLASRLRKSGARASNPAELSNDLNVIETRAHHLRALIESLMHLSDVHMKSMVTPEKPCDLGRLALDIVENQRVLAERVIEYEPPEETALLALDEYRMAQVIENLLSNALKYSPENSPISMQIRVQEAEIALRVYNEASSFSKEQLAHLFEPFYRTRDVEYSSIPGWGLGLAITKEIVERCGGSIQADISDAKGIAFILTFPRVRPD